MRKEALFKSCEKRSIEDFRKAAEIPQFFVEDRRNDDGDIEMLLGDMEERWGMSKQNPDRLLS